MATKTSASGKEQLQDLVDKMKSSSHDVLLAGLGALARAGAGGKRKQGGQDYAALVAEGRKIEPKLVASMQKAWDGLKERSNVMTPPKFESSKLQGVFEERVSAALARLGIPTQKEIQALNQKVDRLLAERNRKPARKRAAKKRAKRRAA